MKYKEFRIILLVEFSLSCPFVFESDITIQRKQLYSFLHRESIARDLHKKHNVRRPYTLVS